ncbi:hypothetical protein PsAD2_00443 [Pseudovibrio axinellae]|uniref:Uncharacterized protein n=1 Tax=Pseudovibrio axinellae TaxID=989403 RepID=A0A166AIH2_9HYPH|nr:hypothetical protein [Pseudovibrio axinellae]KZL21157.1 hypothetical protein PsAD2_00443 [Pseudovibrio axinellae]SEQ89689.1 hypothetical protein SAMN05421798_10547 [Pseudovibrio axinellae]
MKKIALTLSILGLVSAASVAQAALINTANLTSSEAKALVQDKGAIVLTTTPGIYDRYVANGSYCAPHEEAERAYVVTKDSNRSLIGYTCVMGNNES